MSHKGRMDTEHVAVKNEDIMSFTGKLMELENNILSEVNSDPKRHAWYTLANKVTLVKTLQNT